jgi:hypothetical protein
MADFRLSTPAPSANPIEQFDPAAWLDQFRDAGGLWFIDGSGHLVAGWALHDRHNPLAAARVAMWAEIDSDQTKRNAVRALLAARIGEVAEHG